MSFSDFILAILVLTIAGLILWVYDFNPYSNKLHIYTQQCDNMILDNTYCKGSWLDKPVETYRIDKDTQQIIHTIENQLEAQILSNCNIQDRKNWTCVDNQLEIDLTSIEGMLQIGNKNDIRQITRIEWLQNKFLNIIN